MTKGSLFFSPEKIVGTVSTLLVMGFILVVVSCSGGHPAYAWELGAMNAQIDQTNFYVNAGCSGTLIDLKDRLVLTASHCVDEQYKTISKEEIADDGTVTKKDIRVMVPGTVRQVAFKDANQISEVTYRTKLIKVDTKVDLALLEITSDIPNTEFAKIACSDVIRGEEASVVGNPKGILYSSITKGIVSSTQRDYQTLDMGDDTPLLQISSGIVGGNSGGAVYNDKGELVGVPVLGYPQSGFIAFAVPLKSIKEFLKSSKVGAIICDVPRDNAKVPATTSSYSSSMYGPPY